MKTKGVPSWPKYVSIHANISMSMSQPATFLFISEFFKLKSQPHFVPLLRFRLSFMVRSVWGLQSRTSL